MLRLRRDLALGLGGVLLAALVLGALALRSAEVLGTAAYLDFLGDYEVQRVRVLGVEFYVDVSAGRPDTLTAMVLCVGAGAGFLAALELWRSGVPSRALALIVVGALLGFAAVDEALAVHETIGHNLGFLSGLPGVSAPDDLIVAGYAVIAALAALWLRRELRPGRAPVITVLAGAATFALAIVLDAAPLDTPEFLEEYLELLAAVILAVGALLLGADALAGKPLSPPAAPVPAPHR